MDTKTFLGKLLPAQDNYVLYLSKSDTTKWNENHTTIDEVCAAIQKYDQTPTTVYFAVGKFANNVEVSTKTGRPAAKRRKEFATCFKTLCCDIDIGTEHKYQSQAEGVKALFAACDAIKLPRPMIVSSGRGVHAYWPMEKAVTANLWERMSIALRNALQAHGVDIDASKIHDTSMVLRPAGAHHKKDPSNWREVKVVHDVPAQPVQVYADALVAFKTATPPTRANKRPPSAVAAAILEGGTPIHLDNLRKCKQIDALISSGGRLNAAGTVVEEPLWRASLGIAKFCEDQQDAVIRLAGGHPDFDLDNNLQKLAGWRGTGPTNCATLKSLCPEGCVGCKHDGKLTSPAQLSTGVTEVPIVHPNTGETMNLKLPHRYSFNNGCVVYTPPGSDETVFVSPYLMYVVARFTDVEEKRSLAKIAVQFPLEGTRVIDIDINAISMGGAELGKALAMKQVYTYGDNRLLKQYLMTYLQELQRMKSIDYFYKHYGWQADGTFLAGDGLVGQPPSEHTHFEGSLDEYKRLGRMGQQGDLQAWIKGTKMFAHPDLEFQGLVFLMMIGSPIMKGSGLASLFVNMYSKDSGSGKTLTARYGMSAWGNPDTLLRTVNDTDNALYKHFGVLSSTGAYIDEVTTMDNERLRAFVFTLQEGREKSRVTQAADGFRTSATWNMPVFGSSNKDIYEALGTRYSSEAESLRVLQFPMQRVALFEKGGQNIGYTISRFLAKNYGMAGPLIVEEIIRRGGPEAVYEKAFAQFEYKYNFQFKGQERFIQAAFVIADAVNDICKSLGLIMFDGARLIYRGLKYLESLRNVIQESAMNGMDLLMQCLTENAMRIVHYREIQQKGNIKSFIIEPAPSSAIARTEVAYDEKGTFLGGLLYINKQMLKKWCQINGAEYRSIIVGLANEGVTLEDNVRKTLFKGVNGASSSGQTYCLKLDLASHPRLIEANTDSVPSPLNCTPRLAAIAGY